MNSNYDLMLTCFVTHNELQFEFTFDPYNDCTDMEGLKTLAEAEVQKQEELTEEVEIEISDYGSVPEEYANEYSVWDFAAAFAENDLDMDIIVAALECEVSPSQIKEAYSGTFNSDEEFAEDLAEQIGAIDQNAKWPYDCIDWEKAARDIMLDYSSHNGYYFRNF